MPLVSVIIPTYNHRDFVLQTLSSVFAQTFSDYEIIVVNDGSSDTTAELLQPLAAAGLIRYFEQSNAGQAAARNRGVREARGELIAFLDDDDLWLEQNLALQVGLLLAHSNAVAAFSSYEPFPGPDPFGFRARYESGIGRAELLRGNWIITPGQMLIRASLLERIGGFDESIWGADDWDLNLRLSAAGPLLFSPHAVLRYRMHAKNASLDRYRMYVNALRVLKKNGPRSPEERRNWREGWKNVNNLGARLAVDTCCDLLSRGEALRAARQLCVILRQRPDYLLRRSVVLQAFRAACHRHRAFGAVANVS